MEKFIVWQCYFNTSTYPYTFLSATYFCLGFFSPVPFIYPLPFPSSVVYLYFVTYRIFPVPLARVIIPFIPYIRSSVYFHLFVVFVVLAMKPLYNFLDVFNFSPGVNLFHFINFSILLCFFSFSVVTRLLFIHFFMHFVNLFCVLYLFLWHFSLCLYSFFHLLALLY